MTKKREKEEDVIKDKGIKKEIQEEMEMMESEAEAINKKAHEEIIKTAEKYLNNWKRAQADFENYKKDQEKRMEEFRRFACEDLAMQILPVLDNFESSLSHVPEDQKKSAWVEGIMHIKKQIEDILRSYGVSEIEAKAGDKFDPSLHEAVSDPNDANKHSNDSNRVKEIVQKGYKMGERVIRAARVIVE
jgi:molecular chaperone GrpE